MALSLPSWHLFLPYHYMLWLLCKLHCLQQPHCKWCDKLLKRQIRNTRQSLLHKIRDTSESHTLSGMPQILLESLESFLYLPPSWESGCVNIKRGIAGSILDLNLSLCSVNPLLCGFIHDSLVICYCLQVFLSPDKLPEYFTFLFPENPQSAHSCTIVKNIDLNYITLFSKNKSLFSCFALPAKSSILSKISFSTFFVIKSSQVLLMMDVISVSETSSSRVYLPFDTP